MHRPIPFPRSAALACLVLIAFASCGNPDDIGRRAKSGKLRISLSGSGSERLLELRVVNKGKKDAGVGIPAGAIFSSKTAVGKELLVARPVACEAKAGAESVIDVPVFSLSQKMEAAGKAELFNAAEYRRAEGKELISLIAWLNSEKGREELSLDDPDSRSVFQYVLWHLMEGTTFDAELSWKIDGLILNSLLSKQPESVLLLIPEALMVTTEEDLAAAVSALSADPELLKDRLQRNNPAEYEALFTQIKGSLEASGALDFRAKVNSILALAGFPADF